MFNLAQNLMTAAQRWHVEGYSTVLGQRSRTRRFAQKSLFRVGLWPIMSDSEPEIAMSIGLVLAALLEQSPSIRVYRLLAQVSENPDSYEWELNDSQFEVDDWEVEGLDENVAIWGTLEINDGVQLSIEVEDDARDDDATFKLEYKASSIIELLNLLPTVANKFTNWLDVDIVVYPDKRFDIIPDDDDSVVREFLSQIFYWELDYFLELWGQSSDQASALTDLDSLIMLCQQMKSDFGAWMIAQSLSRMMMFDDMSWGQYLIPRAKAIAEDLASHALVSELFGITLFRSNYTLEAFDLLESALVLHTKNKSIWNTLVGFYRELREDLAAIDAYQRAIEADAATSETYLEYGNLITLLSERQIELGSGNNHISPAGRPFTDRYIFTGSNEPSVNLREAATAYQRAFEHDDTNLDALTHIVSNLFFLQDDNAWTYYQTLVERDKEGDITALIIEQLPDDAIESMIGMLQNSLKHNPGQVGVQVNLVRAYLALSKIGQAKAELAKLSQVSVPPRLQAILSRLRLSADNDEFETRISEIKDILLAKGKVSTNDTEFLEDIITKEPTFSEGYRLLAEAYLSWDEQDGALEVLLDYHSKAPFDAEATALLAKVLWDEDEPDLAFAYLAKGLEADRNNATLLSLNSRFLFEEGQDEEAKGFLLRAEEIDPANSELAATRLYIANILTETRND